MDVGQLRGTCVRVAWWCAVLVCAGPSACQGAQVNEVAQPELATGGQLAQGPEPLCAGQGEVNLHCPALPPVQGDCAPRGQCCGRGSNSGKGTDASSASVLNYRVQASHPRNNATGVGFSSITDLVDRRTDEGAVSLLLSLSFPQEGGAAAAGSGAITFGYGRYNCNGTYSYFGPTAAPPHAGFFDPRRYEPVRVGFEVDEHEKTMQNAAVWAEIVSLPSAAVRYPVMNDATFELGWESVERDLLITEMDFSAGGQDCIGARDETGWRFGGVYESFAVLKDNDIEVIQSINQTYCDLLAFGLISVEDASQAECGGEGPRCRPGADGCIWKQLPDSLCPAAVGDATTYRCHLAAKDNPNAEPDYPDVACDGEVPCCDPLAASADLPACNAYRIVRDFTAASAVITDAPTSELQASCL